MGRHDRRFAPRIHPDGRRSALRFVKMHGLGNDFVILDARGGRDPVTPGSRGASATGTAASASTSSR
jgi:hypothetical protein